MNSLKLLISRPFTTLTTRNVAYKSALSLENLYPNSSLKITTPTKPNTVMSFQFSGFIPLDQLDISYDKSSGPGGQNVNKVATKVTLRFHVETANWIDPSIRAKLSEKFKNKITKDGFLLFRSDLTRSQHLNLADCLEKVRKSIVEASYEPPPLSVETQEQIRNRNAKAVRERLAIKRIRSDIKADRRTPSLRDL